MEEARMANNSFPETEGWATIGEIIANIGRVGIPVAAGAAFAPAGIAAGIAMLPLPLPKATHKHKWNWIISNKKQDNV